MASIIRKELSSSPKWVKLWNIIWRDPNGVERTWESAERSTRKGDIDAVGIVPIVMNGNAPKQTILVTQFRPPVGKPIVEFPAGLVDAGETPEQAAMRELKEETGYNGSVFSSSMTMFCDPGMSNANLKLVVLKVDLADPVNQNVKQSLEDGEFIERHMVPLGSLLKELE
ncbi:hypothetical protein HK101_005638, partial [Irineochytrium annulatum]